MMKHYRSLSSLAILAAVLDQRLRRLHHRLRYWLEQQTEEQLGMMALGSALFLLGCSMYMRALVER